MNISGIFSLNLVNSLPNSAVRNNLANVPSLDEIRNALSLVSGNKAGGINGILPEMIKVCSDELLKYPLDLFTGVGINAILPELIKVCSDELLKYPLDLFTGVWEFSRS